MSNNKQSSVEKEFVPYAEALALKQLGFDQPCFAYWNADHSLSKPFLTFVKPFDDEWFIPNPLYSQAFRWFREKYNIEGITQHAEDRLWYKFHISTYLQYGKKNIHAGFEYPTYEEAELACLKKLIEISKQGGNNEQTK